MANSRYTITGVLGAQLNEQYGTASAPHKILTRAATDNGGQAIFCVVDADSSGAAVCSIAASGTAITTTSVVTGYILGPTVSVSSGNYCWAVKSSALT